MACVCNTFDLSGLVPTELPITANLPLVGNGTVADPLYLDFTRFTGTELNDLAAALAGDATALATLTASVVVVSTDAGNILTAGADGGAFLDDAAVMAALDAQGVSTLLCGDATASQALAACLISTDAGNGIAAGADGLLYLDIAGAETTTTLTYNAVTTTLTYTDEDGVATVIDLSDLTTDIYVDGATYNAATQALTLTDNDGGTGDVVVDLSTLLSSFTATPGTSEISHTANGVTVTARRVSADAGNLTEIGSDGGAFLDGASIRSTDFGNDIQVGTDGRLYLNAQAAETTTVLSWNSVTNILSYTSETGAATLIDLSALAAGNVIVSADAGNAVTAGTDGGAYFTVGNLISADAGNILQLGGDGLLSVPSSAFMAAALAP